MTVVMAGVGPTRRGTSSELARPMNDEETVR